MTKIAMPLQSISTHVIRSSNQRTLMEHWNTLASDCRFPSIAKFSPKPTTHSPEQLILWDVESANGERQFRLRQLGTRVVEAFGSGMVGKTMAEVAPPALRATSLDAANECAASGCAIYMVISTVAATGQRVDCERLLLPFGDGTTVQQIVASLQLISFDGTIERQTALRDFEATSSILFSGAIASDFAAKHPQRIPVSEPEVAPPLQPDTPDAEAYGVEKRAAPRRKVRKTGKIFYGKKHQVCTVHDLSSTGALIELADPAGVPDTFSLVLEMESASRRCAAIWRKDRQIGVRLG